MPNVQHVNLCQRLPHLDDIGGQHPAVFRAGVQGVVQRAGRDQEAAADRQGEGMVPWIIICTVTARMNSTSSPEWMCQPDPVPHGISVARTSCQDLLI